MACPSYMLDEGLIQYAGAASQSLDVSYLLSPAEFERLGGGEAIGWIYGRAADGVTLADTKRRSSRSAGGVLRKTT